jgi:hypothetical protein
MTWRHLQNRKARHLRREMKRFAALTAAG